jgi:hypothetical protein
MSTVEDDAPVSKYVFKARYGAEPSKPRVCTIVDPIHLEVDPFIRDILGLDKEKKS